MMPVANVMIPVANAVDAVVASVDVRPMCVSHTPTLLSAVRSKLWNWSELISCRMNPAIQLGEMKESIQFMLPPSGVERSCLPLQVVA